MCKECGSGKLRCVAAASAESHSWRKGDTSWKRMMEREQPWFYHLPLKPLMVSLLLTLWSARFIDMSVVYMSSNELLLIHNLIILPPCILGILSELYMRLNGRVQAGVRRLHQLVHSGLWRATLIQRDHPSTLPTSSTIIINVWRTFHAWMDCCCIMSGHVLVTWHFTSPMVYLCIVLQYNKWSSMHWEFDEAWGYIHDSGHLRQGLFCLLSCQSSVTIYCTYVACYTCCTQGAMHALVKIVRYSCSLCNHMPYDRRQATWWEVVFVHNDSGLCCTGFIELSLL